MGERDGRKPEGFDYTGKTVVMTTTAGTQCITQAKKADTILLGNFVCAQATIEYIKKQHPQLVTLVPLGEKGLQETTEDQQCAKYLKHCLQGKKPDTAKIQKTIQNSKTALKYQDKKRPWYHQEDLQMAIEFDKFDFILKANRKKGQTTIQTTIVTLIQ